MVSRKVVFFFFSVTINYFVCLSDDIKIQGLLFNCGFNIEVYKLCHELCALHNVFRLCRGKTMPYIYLLGFSMVSRSHELENTLK